MTSNQLSWLNVSFPTVFEMELGLLQPNLNSIAQGLGQTASTNGAIGVMPQATRLMLPGAYLAASVQAALGLADLSSSGECLQRAQNQVLALLADAKQTVMTMGLPCVFDHWAPDSINGKAVLHLMRIHASEELGGAWLIHH